MGGRLRWAQCRIRYFENSNSYDNSVNGSQIENCPWAIDWHRNLWPWMTLNCHQVCINGWTDGFDVWGVDLGGPQEAQVQPCSPGCPSVPFMEGHICGTWRIPLHRPSAAVMWPYVKLLWPLVTEYTWNPDLCCHHFTLFKHNYVKRGTSVILYYNGIGHSRSRVTVFISTWHGNVFITIQKNDTVKNRPLQSFSQ